MAEGCLELDMAFRVDAPPAPTESSTPDEILKYKRWERSNRLCLLYMKSHISKSIGGFIPETDYAKVFMKAIMDQFARSDKALASTLMKRLSSKSFKAIFNVTADVKRTLMFNVFVLCQVFNEFNARELEKNVFEGIRRNKLFLGIVGVMVMLQVVMVEFMKKFADTERLTWSQWGVCVGFASVSWPVAWVAKWIAVLEKLFLLGGEGVATPESDLAPATDSGNEAPLLPKSSPSLTPSESSLASPTNSGVEVPQLSKTFSLRHRKKELDPTSATNTCDDVPLPPHAVYPSTPSESASASVTNSDDEACDKHAMGKTV